MNFQRGNKSWGSSPAQVLVCESSRQVTHLLPQQLGVISSPFQAVDCDFLLARQIAQAQAFFLVLLVSHFVLTLSELCSL